MKKIYSARDALQAHFLRHMLEAQGIEAKVLGDILGMAKGELPFTTDTLPAVWVREDDAAAAAAIVEEFENRDDAPIDPEADETPWQCPHCNETIEGQFTACWNCQNPRNGD